WDENTSNQQTMSNAFYIAPSNTGSVNYQFFSFTETASTNKTRLDFHGIDANGSILLDNVSVLATATTNPATLTVTASPPAPRSRPARRWPPARRRPSPPPPAARRRPRCSGS